MSWRATSHVSVDAPKRRCGYETDSTVMMRWRPRNSFAASIPEIAVAWGTWGRYSFAARVATTAQCRTRTKRRARTSTDCFGLQAGRCRTKARPTWSHPAASHCVIGYAIPACCTPSRRRRTSTLACCVRLGAPAGCAQPNLGAGEPLRSCVHRSPRAVSGCPAMDWIPAGEQAIHRVSGAAGYIGSGS